MSLVDETRATLDAELDDDETVAIGQDKRIHRAAEDGSCHAQCRVPARVTIMDWATAKRLGYGSDDHPVCDHRACFGGEA